MLSTPINSTVLARSEEYCAVSTWKDPREKCCNRGTRKAPVEEDQFVAGWKNGTANNINGYGLPSIHQTVRRTTHDRRTGPTRIHTWLWNVVELGTSETLERYGARRVLKKAKGRWCGDWRQCPLGWTQVQFTICMCGSASLLATS